MGRANAERRTPLVGRAQELAELHAAFDASLEGTPQIVVIAGEAGIGKSRLLSEFLRERTDRVAMVGHCLELGPDGPPFAPFAMMLRAAVAELGPKRVAELAGPGSRDLAVLLPELGEGERSDPLGRGRLFEALASLIEHAAEDRPLVVAVEDLHWSDSSTRDLIAFLLRTVTTSRVLFVLTYRSDELPRRHPLVSWLSEIDRLPRATRIPLERLNDDDIDTLVRALAGDMPARTGARIRQRSEGVPFFVEELTSCCGDHETPPLPESLRDLMLARLERLSEPSRTIVRMASCANTQVDHGVLRAMAGMAEEALDAALRDAVAGQVLTVDAGQRGYSFRHALMREAVHGDLLPGEHARLHAQYAGALAGTAGPEQAGEVAHHWMSAHEAGPAFEWSLRAADHSRSVYAWQEELNHLNRALDLWDQVEGAAERAGLDRIELVTRAGRAAGDAGRSEHAIAFFDAALAEVDQSAQPQRLAGLLVRRAAQCSQPRDTLPDLERARALAGPGSAEQAAALSYTAATLLVMGRVAEAQPLARDAIAAAEAAADPALQGHARNTLGCSLIQTGQAAVGFAELERARELALGAGDTAGLLRYYGNRSDALIGEGRFADAVAVTEAGRAVAVQRGLNRSMGAFVAANEAEALLHAGRYDEAVVIIDDVLRLDPPSITRGHVHLLRAVIRLRRGDCDGAADDLDAAVERLGFGVNQPQYRLPVAAVRAGMASQSGRHQEALRLVTEAASAFAFRSIPPPVGWLCAFTWAQVTATALAALASGSARHVRDDDWAAALVGTQQVVAELSRVSGSTGIQALLAALLEQNRAEAAQLAAASAEHSAPDPDPEDDGGLPAAGVRRWRQAADSLLRCEGLRYERAYAQIRLSEQHLAHGDRSAAREALTAAWELVSELGADSLRPAASRAATAARLQLRPVRRGAELLTEREREVLSLVATGRSNKAISDELYISVKTTSVHVSHILAKIGATSRTEAAAWAHEHGLAETAGRP